MIMRKRYLLILILFFAGFGLINAQTGPGGIGNADGSNGQPENLIWLDASKLSSFSVGDTWTDQSGNSYNATHIDAGGGTAPALNTRNGFNTLNFDGLASYLRIPDDSNGDNRLDGMSSMTIMSAYVPGTNTMGLISKRKPGGSIRSWSLFQIGSNLYGDASSTRVNGGAISSYGFSSCVVNGDLKLYYNGDFKSSGGSGITIPDRTENITIGLFDESDNRYFDGEIAELIVFGEGLNSAQRTIVENYFSTKYNIAFTTVGNDMFTGNDAAYKYKVAGIGQESDGSQLESSSAGFYVDADVATLDNGEYVMFAHNNTSNSVVATDLPLGTEARWARDWYVEKTGSLNVTLTFDFPEGISGDYPQEITNYVLLVRSGTTGSYTEVTATVSYGDADQVTFDVTDVNLSNGYYTIGTKDQINSLLTGASGVTWYTLKTGDWNDWETWTLDPSGALPNNPGHDYPQLTSESVVIKNGKIVTMNLNNIHCASLKVDGSLKLATTTGHQFDKISGTGQILMAADNFPAFTDYSEFVDAGQDEGKVVYYGSTSYTLSNSYTFFNMEIDMDAGQTVTLLNDYTLNGDLTVTSGTLQINDNAATTNLNLTVNRDVKVETNGFIHTGSANARHQFNFYGDFSNKGEVKFTNRASAGYTSEATDGIVDANFLSDSKDQSISCEGTTNFYRIEIDKGSDATYVLNVDASDVVNFNLYGFSNGSNSANALGLLNGTVRLGSNINLPLLAQVSNYSIPATSCLWIDGAVIKKNTGNAITVNGLLHVTDGELEIKVANGITLYNNGLIKIEGGELTTNIIKTGTAGAVNVGGYFQSGGTVNIINPTSTIATYYHFSLTYPGNTFTMIDGILHVYDANGNDSNSGGIFIASAAENINVTGGTVIAEIANTTNPFKITSTAPFYNLVLRNTYNSTTDHILDAGANINGNSDADLAAQPLVVLNDFTIEDNCFLDHNGQDITIGGGMSISANSQKQTTNPKNNYGLYYNSSKPNTLMFNGSGSDTIHIKHDVDDGYELYVWNLTVNKTDGSEIVLKGDPNKDPTKTSLTKEYNNKLLLSYGTVDVVNGTLNQGHQSIRTYGPVKISNSGVFGVYESGTTPLTAYIMLKDGTVIDSEEGAEIGNMKLNPSDGKLVTISSNVHIKRIGYYNGSLNLQSYNAKVDFLHKKSTETNVLSSFCATDRMIYSDANASDGGLSIQITGNGTYTFPLGTMTSSTRYTYAEVTISGFSDDGYITIRPVDGELKTTNLSGGVLLDYYWRVGYEGFTSNPTIQYEFLYDESDVGSNENQYRPGKVLDGNPYTRSTDGNTSKVDNVNNLITFDGGGSGFTLEKANYTAGRNSRFTGLPTIYYSRWLGNAANTNWTTNSSWTLAPNDIDGNGTVDDYEKHDSRQPSASNYPHAGDIAVVGWVPYGDPNYTNGYPHGIEVNSTVDFAELVFTQMLDANDGNPTCRKYTYNFQFRPTVCINPSGVLSGNSIRGEGMFWCRSAGGTHVDPDFSLIDIGDFVSQDSAYIAYESTSNSYVYDNIPVKVPNLLISGDGWGSHNRDFNISTDIEVMQDFELLGDVNLVLSSGSTGDVLVHDDLRIFRSNANGNDSGGDGEIAFPNSTSRIIEVYGDLELINDHAKISVRSPNTTVNEHTLMVHGDILQDNASGGGLQLYTASNQDYVKLILKGLGTNLYLVRAGAIANLSNLLINKGTDQSSSFTFNSDFTLNGPTSGAGVDKALELQNGTLILDDVNIDIDLTTGDDNFEIPQTTGLEVKQGTVNASGGSGILLDGILKVSGGTVDMSGGDNSIQYSASGNATIEVTGGTLKVGSQIRRGTTSTEGILTYIQSGGTVEIGADAAGVASRGIFEILNTGSSFTHTGGTFTLVNDLRSNPTSASLYFNPETLSLGAGTTITFGNGNTTSGNFTLYGGKALGNITTNNSGTSLTLSVVPCTINEDLNIGAGTEFDANGLVLTMNGDFVNSGTFTATANDTYFSGTSDQTITGITEFYNLYKNSSANLTLADDITVSNELHLISGTFDDGGNDLFAKGDMYVDITTTSGVSNDGIVANGSSQQNLYGDPIFAKLKTDNANGIFAPTGNTITITGELKMNQGIFDIGQNLLVLTKNADITAVSSFSETNMVQTNISFTDAGIKKYFPAISSATTFVYPMGSGGKYTPVTLNITNSDNDNTYIRVKAADEIHPSITPTNGDPDNVLKYYWILDADGASGFTGTATMQGYSGDVQVTGSNSASDYITARLLSRSSGNWDKYLTSDFNEGTTQLSFTFAGTDDVGIDGDYTAGVVDAIPDQVALYTSTKIGDWTDQTTWAPTSPAGGPRGARVLIKHDVTISNNYIVSYATQIDNGGKLIVNETYGHRLGNTSGVGTIYMERGDMPAGDYTEFFGATGGTVEYGYTGVLNGNEDYDILSSMPEVNNVIVSGSGERGLPNIEVQLFGSLTVNGPNLIHKYEQKVNLKKDLTFTSGTYTSKSGVNSTMNMNGSSRQSINGPGSFTGANSFYNFEINNPGGVTLNTPVEIDNNMYFGNGVIFSSSSNTITITNTSNTCVTGGKSTSYVEGPLRKTINNSDYFVFPVGDALRYGEIKIDIDGSSGGTWEAQYYNHSPGDDSMDPETLDATGNLAYVSHGEYWRVEAPATGNAANLTMRWDSNSGVNPNSDFTLARWKDLSTDAWSEVSPGTVSGTTTSGTTDLASVLTFGFNGVDNSHYITFGTISIPSFSWTGSTSTDWFTASNWTNSTLPDASADVTIADVANDPVIGNSGIAQVHDLTLNSGATLTMQPGARMTVNGDLTTNDGLTIENSVASPTSLINLGSVIGDVTVQWTYPDNRYMYVGHSVDGVKYSDYSSTFTTPATDLWLYRWPNSWTRITTDVHGNDGLSGTETDKLEGYAVKSKEGTSTQVISYSGALHYGTYSSTYNGYKLIANPYQAYIDMEGLGSNIGTADPTVWTSTNVSGELAYATYNISSNAGVNGGTRYVAPGQSFWIEHTANTALTISPSLRSFNDRAALKGVPLSPGDELRFMLSEGEFGDELVLLFRSVGTINEITEYDSKKRMGTAKIVPNLYALKGGEKVVVGAYPNTMESDTVSLGYKFSQAKEITLHATNINSFNVIDNVYLFDKKTGIEINLRETPSYTFMSNVGEDADRFEVYFTHLTTGISDVGDKGFSGEHIQIYGTGQKGIVKVTEEILHQAQGKGVIRLYNAAGTLLKEINLTDIRTTIDLPASYGVYIVEVRSAERFVTGKVMRME
jgi:hypothetical protein